MYCNKCGHQNPDESAFCGKCGTALVQATQGEPLSAATPPAPPPASQPQPRPAPPAPTKKGPSCWLVGCLSVVGLFIFFIIMAALIPSTTHSTSENSTKPHSYAGGHEGRQAIHQYWVSATNETAAALSYTLLAIDAAKGGDTTTASTALEKGTEAANQAGMDSVTNVPDGWDDVEGSLSAGDEALKRALTAARKGLDSNAPSDWSDASQALEEAGSYFDTATGQARTHYKALGGHNDDIQDPRDEAKQVYNTLRGLSQ